MSNTVWTILKVLGMLVVLLYCMDFVHKMAVVGSITGSYWPLVLVLFVDVGFFYWAYRVIWKPMRPGDKT